MAESLGDGFPVTPPRAKVNLKRPRGTPTLQTPQRPLKRIPLRESGGLQAQSSRRLPFFPQTSAATWSQEELKALVEFILFHCSVEKWPTHKLQEFWRNAAEFIKKRTHASYSRTGRQ